MSDSPPAGSVGPAGPARPARPVALLTGVSRRQGIAWTVARRLLADGHDVLTTGWAGHDAEMPWGADEVATAELEAWERDTAASGGPRLVHLPADLSEPDAPAWLVREAIERLGRLDVVVAAHAHSTSLGLADTTADDLDRAWVVNARACVLLAQAFGRAPRPTDPGPGGGAPRRLVLFTSGQHLGPMPDEIAYAVSKGAIQQMTWTLAEALADVGITVNCVNPGPVDTGYADPALQAEVAARFPSGRWGRPGDVANLVAFLVGPDGGWLTGQTLNSEGGFRR